MNILKRISGIIISAIVLFTIVFLPDNRVSAAGLSVSVSASKVNVGQTVTATISIPSGYGATVAVSFDSSVLTYSFLIYIESNLRLSTYPCGYQKNFVPLHLCYSLWCLGCDLKSAPLHFPS